MGLVRLTAGVRCTLLISQGLYASGTGRSTWSLQVLKTKIAALDKDLTPSKPAAVSTLTFTMEWEYSDGSTILAGKLPGDLKKFSAPYFSLSTIDDDLKQFVGEISR